MKVLRVTVCEVCILNIAYYSMTETILNLLKVKIFSPKGSSALVKEQSTYIFFRDVLDEIER